MPEQGRTPPRQATPCSHDAWVSSQPPYANATTTMWGCSLRESRMPSLTRLLSLLAEMRRSAQWIKRSYALAQCSRCGINPLVVRWLALCTSLPLASWPLQRCEIGLDWMWVDVEYVEWPSRVGLFGVELGRLAAWGMGRWSLGCYWFMHIELADCG